MSDREDILDTFKGMSKQEVIDLINKMKKNLEDGLPDTKKPAGKTARGNKSSNEIAVGAAKRQDGSVRQMVAQDGKGGIVWQKYFLPDTFVEQISGSVKDTFEETFKIVSGKESYHWAEAFTDKELSESYFLDDNRIKQLRDEATVANSSKLQYHLPKDIEDHVRARQTLNK